MPFTEKQLKDLVISAGNHNLDSVLPFLVKGFTSRSNENAIVTSLNSLLQSSKTCPQALELLIALLTHVSPETIVQHVPAWIRACIVKHDLDFTKDLKLRSLTHILASIPANDALNKKIASENLLDVLKMILSASNDREKIVSTECLTVCMQNYPGWFTNHRDKVDTFLLEILESGDGTLVTLGSIAFHHFQQTGSAGVEGTHYTANFANSLRKLCVTVHTLFDAIYDSQVTDMGSGDRPAGDHFDLINGSKHGTEEERTNSLTRKLCNCLAFIRAMIIKKYPSEKQVTPKHIVDIISRGLSIHMCLSNDNVSLDTFSLALLSMKIQKQLLKLLKALIIGHASNLLPFSYRLNRIFLNLLKRFSTCDCFNDDCEFKTYLTRTFMKWIRMSHSGTIAFVQSSLIPLLKNDVIPNRKELVLHLQKLTKKTKRKPVGNVPNDSNNREPSKIEIRSTESNCINALRLLDCLLETCSLHHLKTNDLREITEFLISTISDIQTGSKISKPFDSLKCQTLVYSFLLNLIKQEHLNFVPSPHLIASLLRNRTDWTNETCNGELSLLEVISQPVCPSLYIRDVLHEDRFERTDDVENGQSMEEIGNEEECVELENGVEKPVASETKITILSEVIYLPDKDLAAIPSVSGVQKSTTLRVPDVENSATGTISGVKEGTTLTVVEHVCNDLQVEPPHKKQKVEAGQELEEMCNDFQDLV